MKVLKFLGSKVVIGSEKELKETYHEMIQELRRKEKEIERLRGLIGFSCDECNHKSYCKHSEQYDETWMLGCRDFEQYKKRTSEEFDRTIGNVKDILWDKDKR